MVVPGGKHSTTSTSSIALLCVKTLNASDERCTFSESPVKGPHCEDAIAL